MSSVPRAKIDFKKYRSEELYESVSELIDLRGIYAKSVWRVFLFIIIFLGVNVMVFQSCPAIILALALAYGFVSGLFVGTFFAVASAIRESLDNLLKVVSLMLEVCKQVAHDIGSISEGKTRFPTAKELVQGVYLDVFLPLVERAVAEQLGILAKPILFLYRMTFGRMVKLVIRLLPASILVEKDQSVDEAGKEILQGLEAIHQNESAIVGALSWTQQKIMGLGAWFKFLVMLPVYFVLTMVFVFVVVPLLVMWWMTRIQPETVEAFNSAWPGIKTFIAARIT